MQTNKTIDVLVLQLSNYVVEPLIHLEKKKLKSEHKSLHMIVKQHNPFHMIFYIKLLGFCM